MSKQKDQNDKPYAYINKEGKGEAPVTFTQLVKLVHAGVLTDDDKIRRQNESEWKRKADADWLMYLPAPEADTKLPDYAWHPADVAEPHRTKKQSSSRSTFIIIAVVVVVLVLGVVGVLRTHVGEVVFGGTERGARSYVADSLSAWKKGRDSPIREPLYSLSSQSPPILVDYEIVDSTKVGSSPNRYEVTAQLTFSTLAGGSPVEQVRFRVRWDRDTTSWKVFDSYQY